MEMCSTLFPCQDPLFPLDWPFITQHVVQTTRQTTGSGGEEWKGGEAQTRDERRSEARLQMIFDEASLETQ